MHRYLDIVYSKNLINIQLQFTPAVAPSFRVKKSFIVLVPAPWPRSQRWPRPGIEPCACQDCFARRRSLFCSSSNNFFRSHKNKQNNFSFLVRTSHSLLPHHRWNLWTITSEKMEEENLFSCGEYFDSANVSGLGMIYPIVNQDINYFIEKGSDSGQWKFANLNLLKILG